MANEEELNLITNNLGKIRYMYDDNGQKVVIEASKPAIQAVSERFDVLKDNFEYFAKRPNSIMYPNEFIFAIQQFDGGKQLLFDNIDYILKINNFKRNAMISALYDVDGIEDIFLKDFKNRFNLFIKGNTEPEEDIFNKKHFSPKHNMCDIDRANRMLAFLRITSNGQNAAEIFEENKELFLTPKYGLIIADIVSLLSGKPEFQEFLNGNLERIIKCAKEEDVISIYKSLEFVCPEQYEQHRFVIEQVFGKILERIKLEKVNADGDEHRISYDQASKTCGRIVAQNQSREIESLLKFIARGNEIEICGIGGFSIAVKAGDKILKIGGDRLPGSPFEIKNHPRLIRPIIRKKDVSVLQDHPLYVEIQDEVDTDTEITDEELLTVYRELRESGIKWCDASKKNLGRLKADNYGYPIGVGVPSNNQSLGLVGEDSLDNVLKKGELVVIDLDLLYPADYEQAYFTPQVPDFIVKFEEEFSKKEKEKKQEQAHNPQEDSDYGEI